MKVSQDSPSIPPSGEPLDRTIKTKVTRKMKRRLEALAVRRGISFPDLIREALDHRLGRRPGESHFAA